MSPQEIANTASLALVVVWGLWQLAALAEGVRRVMSGRMPPKLFGLINPGARRLVGGTFALAAAYGASATIYGAGDCIGGLKRLAECTAMNPAIGQTAYNTMLSAALLGPGLGILALIGAAILEVLSRKGQ